MAVDLRSVTTFQRFSLVLMDDCLIKLEHERTQDRVRRYSYDSIQNIIIWRTISWWRVIICGICLLLPGIGLLFVDNTPSTVIGFILIGTGIAPDVVVRLLQNDDNPHRPRRHQPRFERLVPPGKTPQIPHPAAQRHPNSSSHHANRGARCLRKFSD